MRSSRVLVADLDGTLTRGGEDRLKPHVRGSLISARKAGWILILATGRDRRYLEGREDIKGLFDAWVAEAGLAIYVPGSGRHLCLAPESWRYEVLKLRSLPFVELKENTVAFSREYLDVVRAELERLGIKAVLKDNRGTLILLPEGVDKGVGVREAMRLLGVDGYVVAVGDSKVDLELLEIADLRVAVADADPELKKIADHVTSRGNGDGVAELIQQLLSGGL